jgi:hypothetical protein
MNTYEFAELVYETLDDRETYENLIKAFEKYPDEMIKFMKEVHKKQDPDKQPVTKKIAQNILYDIEDSIDMMGQHNYHDTIDYLCYEAAVDLASELKDLAPNEIKEVIDLVDRDATGDNMHFYLFRKVIKELKDDYHYAKFDELVNLIRNIKNPNINFQEVNIMLGE